MPPGFVGRLLFLIELRSQKCDLLHVFLVRGADVAQLRRGQEGDRETGGRCQIGEPRDPRTLGQGGRLRRLRDDGRGHVRSHAAHDVALHARALQFARGGVRRLRGVADEIRGAAQRPVLGRALCTAGDVRCDLPRLGLGQRAQRVDGNRVEQGFVVSGGAVHAALVFSASRNLRKPLRMRVFTVPSGVPVLRAISSWVTPAKKPSSIS